MAPRAKLSIPTNAPLPHDHLLPSSCRAVLKAFNRFSRPSLVRLALEWLESPNLQWCKPLLAADEEDSVEDVSYTPAQSLEELREIYHELQNSRGSKRDIIDRILECDWRRGISLYQLATAETRYLRDHQTSQRWTALRLTKLQPNGHALTAASDDDCADHVPHFHLPTFLHNLQREVSPIARAHYYLTRLDDLPLTLLRILTLNSTPTTSASSLPATSTSQSLTLLFPPNTPFIYISHTSTSSGQPSNSEARSLRSVVLAAVPKALSRPQNRYTLHPTSLSTKSLTALLSLRGPDRSNNAAGGWSIFADGSVDGHLLDYSGPQRRGGDTEEGSGMGEMVEGKERMTAPPTAAAQKRRLPRFGERDEVHRKRRVLIAAGRFGTSALPHDGKGLERFDVRIEDPFPPSPFPPSSAPPSSATLIPDSHPDPANPDSQPEPHSESDAWTPDLRLSFHGSHVFAGIRQLVEEGVVDGAAMPGWMTGEVGVSVGVVRAGRMAGGKEG
ncbi:hypothetical protein LTR04_006341 [Oleoguttula sp. CCFEE 6159]|nr:hypothetical protein LTR04_006341 [Oleoguttula sp. CCFEE 6159]